MLDAVFPAFSVEGMAPEACCRAVPVLGQISEQDAVAGQHDVNLRGLGCDHVVQKSRSGLDFGALGLLRKGGLRRSVNDNEEMELLLRRTQFRNVDVELADRIAVEALFGGFGAGNIRQSANSKPLQAPM